MTDWVKSAEDQEVPKLKANPTLDAPAVSTTANKDNEPDVADPAETSLLIKILGKGLVNTKLSLDVQQKNPNSPLHSVKTFEALHLKPELLKGIYAMGFNTPSKIQETALPTLLADPPQNMIAQSQSGTGKTAAFVLAMLSRVNTALNHPQVLCLSPTYELAIQTGEVAARMGQFCPDIKLRFAVRGEEGKSYDKTFPNNSLICKIKFKCICIMNYIWYVCTCICRHIYIKKNSIRMLILLFVFIKLTLFS